MANLVEREGEQIQALLEKKAECILEDHGFNTDGSIKDQEKVLEFIRRGNYACAREGLSSDRRAQ